jgi:protein arginine kinase activator
MYIENSGMEVTVGDRPVECGQCKKTITVLYKEIVGATTTCTEMCTGCPILSAKLHGECAKGKPTEKESSLCCGSCGTSAQSIKMGEPLGCGECYAVFGDILLSELLESDAASPSLKKKVGLKRPQAIHIGKSPDNEQNIILSTKLASLNEALNEALKRENYEQAAWIRDQIKALTDQGHDTKT